MDKLDNFAQAVEYLYSTLPVFHRQGPAAYKPDIGNIRALLEYAGNPHLTGITYIHIAGTNGKGSVAHLTASYFQELGLKTAVYTSPHYVDMRERMKINGVLITETSFVDALNQFLPVLETIKPSYFELLCAMAFYWFDKEKVDIAIIETGLGGRLDSTNIILPVLSIITNIGLDHTNLLGNTLPLIAGEKAGIIKTGIPVVIGESHEETTTVFINKAIETGSPLYFAEDLIEVKSLDAKIEGVTYEATLIPSHQKMVFTSPLFGQYQTKNIRTALCALKILADEGIIGFDEEKISAAFSNVVQNTYFIGRWQVIQRNPTIVLESAHNTDGIALLKEQLSTLSFGKLIIIFGTVSDKSPEPVLNLLPKKAQYIWTQASIMRALDANSLQTIAKESAGLTGIASPDIRTALDQALLNCSPDDLIVVTGSIFLVADALTVFQKLNFEQSSS